MPLGTMVASVGKKRNGGSSLGCGWEIGPALVVVDRTGSVPFTSQLRRLVEREQCLTDPNGAGYATPGSVYHHF